VSRPDDLHIRTRDRGIHVGIFYGISLYVSRIAALTLFDLKIRHQNRVPLTGPAILAANHQSVLDPWLVGSSLDRRAAYLARETLFRVPILGWLIRKYDTLPVPRESTVPRAALEICLKVLEKGRALILFPEGTRSYDGRLQPLKRGIVLLARRTGAPVVPIIVHGSFRCWPRSRLLPRPGRIDLVFGEPIQFEKDESSDSFVERLERAYRRLAVEAGAEDMLPVESRAEVRGTEPPASTIHGERTPLLEAAAAERSPPASDGSGKASSAEAHNAFRSET
jgi:1-acyl-sn-glycerol-3-phosphate acyltransferase